MRTFYSGSGADTTAAVQAYFAANKQLNLATLFVINTAPCYAGQYLGQQFLVTDFPAPLRWNYRGTFTPANIKYGSVESKIGLQADSVDITWSPTPGTIMATSGSSNLTIIQGLFNGIFDNGLLEIWRCLMPTMGDCNTLGACLMFAGRIGDLELDRLAAKIKVLSLLETINEQVPTNLIEPGNILTQYSVGVIPSGGPPSFTVVAGSTASTILATATSGSAVVSTYDTGYILMGNGTILGGTYRRIREQTVSGGNYIFYLTQPLPFAPTVGDTMMAYIPMPSGYSLLPFNTPFPLIQNHQPDSTNWTWGLNGTTMTGAPTDTSSQVRTYGFMYHTYTAGSTTQYSDVYTRISGGAANSWNDNWPVVNPDGTVTWPGGTSNVQPSQNEPGVGTPTNLFGFPFVPVPINSAVAI